MFELEDELRKMHSQTIADSDRAIATAAALRAAQRRTAAAQQPQVQVQQMAAAAAQVQAAAAAPALRATLPAAAGDPRVAGSVPQPGVAGLEVIQERATLEGSRCAVATLKPLCPLTMRVPLCGAVAAV
jgi:hypothetical protein